MAEARRVRGVPVWRMDFADREVSVSYRSMIPRMPLRAPKQPRLGVIVAGRSAVIRCLS
jgi:hypothetical protein